MYCTIRQKIDQIHNSYINLTVISIEVLLKGTTESEYSETVINVYCTVAFITLQN